MNTRSKLRALVRIEGVEDVTLPFAVLTGILLIQYREVFPDMLWELLVGFLWLMWALDRLADRWDEKLQRAQPNADRAQASVDPSLFPLLIGFMMAIYVAAQALGVIG